MSTDIEWCDETWNPTTGCTKVSPGCDHCYAERITERFHGKGSFERVVLHSDRLHLPYSWRKPRRVFVNSMSDLFHEAVPDRFIADVFAVMALNQRHTFQILTKRHGRMRSLLNDRGFLFLLHQSIRVRGEQPTLATLPLPNVWLGVSVEDQKWADIRIPALLDTPAAVRFLSCEPLLGPIDLEFVHYFDAVCGGCSGLISPAHVPGCGTEPGMHWGVDWVIVGGESGPGARPMHPGWAQSIRDHCQAAGVPFLFKQWGAHVVEDQSPLDIVLPHTSWRLLGERGPSFYRVGKKAAGRELDGRTWDQYPEPVTR